MISVSMAGLYLANPGPNMGIWEFYRRQAGAPLENYCVAVDFGQSVDNWAICVMSRSSAPAPESAAVEPVEQPTGGIVDLPARVEQPVSTAPPPLWDRRNGIIRSLRVKRRYCAVKGAALADR